MPTGLAWAPDGTHILVVLDGWDRLGVLAPAMNTITAQTPVGVAPRDVVVVGDHAFVSNEGGRKPTSGDFTNLSYDSPVVADKVDGRASTGTVSEVDLAAGKVVQAYKVGLDPSSLLAHGREVLVTNSSDDTVSVIDTAKTRVTQTFDVNPLPGQPFGSSPNALEFIDPTHLVVSLGRNNALAVYEYAGGHKAVALDGGSAAGRIDEALELVDLGDHALARVGGYSVGMRQRLGIAAALLRDPKLLILDEPASGLDPAGMRDMRALISRLPDDGVTVLLSSHDMDEVEDLCDDVTIMRAGRVVFDGSMERLRAQAPDPAFRLSTNDDERALAIARGEAGIVVAPEGDGLLVHARRERLDAYMIALGRADVAVRRLELESSALETLFFRLTERDPQERAEPAVPGPVPGPVGVTEVAG